MCSQTLSVLVVLSSVTEHGLSLVVISVSPYAVLPRAKLTISRYDRWCRYNNTRQLYEHRWWNRYPNARCLHR